MDDPETLRSYAALFDKMLPATEATCAAVTALRFMADEFERRRHRCDDRRVEDRTAAHARNGAVRLR